MTVAAEAGGLAPFHLAIPVHDLAAARAFYGELLGCPEGRSSQTWIDFDFFGHQLVAHLSEDHPGPDARGHVDGHLVPIPHFGVVLEWEIWHALVARLRTAEMQFGMEPQIRFTGLPGEQATTFFVDPSGNAIEMKAFKDRASLFAK